jgi:hypothetical protein
MFLTLWRWKFVNTWFGLITCLENMAVVNLSWNTSLLIIWKLVEKWGLVEFCLYEMVHGEVWEGKWRGNRRLEWSSSKHQPSLWKWDGTWWHMARKVKGNRRVEWVSSKHHTTMEHSLSSTVQTLPTDVHTSAVSIHSNSYMYEVTWICLFHRKTKFGCCVYVISF